MHSLKAKPKSSFSVLLVVSILLLIVMAIIPQLDASYYVRLLMSIFLYIILTVSWATFCGPSGYLSIGSAAFVGIGIYVMALLGEELPLPLVIIFAGIASALLAFVAGFASLRVKGIYFAMFTLGLSEAFRHLTGWWEANIGHTTGRWVIVVDTTLSYYIMLIILVVTLVASYAFRHSKFGLALQGIGEEETAAQHMGINVNALKIVTFTISAFFMGAAGAVVVTQHGYVDADSAFNLFYSFMPALMALFGGIGSVYGWIIGAVFFTVLAELLLTEFPYYYMFIFGAVIAVIVMFFPMGLVGTISKFIKGRRSRKHATT